jgi:hypothetical protein
MAYNPPSNLNFKHTISPAEPSLRSVGDYWDEQIDNHSKIIQWIWSGTNWLSRDIFQRSPGILISGQSLSIGSILGTIASNTDDIPIETGNVRSIYLIYLSCGFKINSGNLTHSSYWRLNFKSAGNIVQTLNIISGNNNETTGEIRKTSNPINTIYPHNGRYSITLTKEGGQANPPAIVSPTAMIEYRLVR